MIKIRCLCFVAFYYGSPLMLILPKDSDGNACGFDNRERIALGQVIVSTTFQKFLLMRFLA